MIALPLLAALAAAVYLRAALRTGWRAARTARFVGGTAALALAPLIGEGGLAGHMVEHALLVAVAAPLVVLGSPVALALRVAGPRGRAALLGVLRSPFVRWVAHSAVAWGLFVATQWAAHAPGAIAAVDSSPALHAFEHGWLVSTAILFWSCALGGVPLPHPLGASQRAVYLFTGAAATDLAAIELMAAGHAGAGAAMLAGMLPLGLAAVLVTWRWVVAEEGRVARREVAGVGG
jgi:putative membrane protein